MPNFFVRGTFCKFCILISRQGKINNVFSPSRRAIKFVPLCYIGWGDGGGAYFSCSLSMRYLCCYVSCICVFFLLLWTPAEYYIYILIFVISKRNKYYYILQFYLFLVTKFRNFCSSQFFFLAVGYVTI
jgi:hypothetical protein